MQVLIIVLKGRAKDVCDSARDEHSTWEQPWMKLLMFPATSTLQEVELFKFNQINQWSSLTQPTLRTFDPGHREGLQRGHGALSVAGMHRLAATRMS